MKIRSIIFIAIVSIVSNSVLANTIDSLENIIKNTTDSQVQFDTYLVLMEEIAKNGKNYDRDFEKYLDKAIEVAQKLDVTQQEIALSSKARHLYMIGKSDEAKISSEQIIKTSKSPLASYIAHDILATLYRERGQMDSSFIHHTQGLDITVKNDLKKFKTTGYQNVAIHNAMRGKYEVADSLLQLGLKNAKELDDPKEICLTLLNLGITSDKSGQYTKANEYFLEGYEYLKNDPENQYYMDFLAQIAKYSINLGDTTQALQYLDNGFDAIKNKEKLRHSEFQVLLIYNQTASASGNFEKAKEISNIMIEKSKGPNQLVQKSIGQALMAETLAKEADTIKSNELADEALQNIDIVMKDFLGVNMIIPLLETLFINGRNEDGLTVLKYLADFNAIFKNPVYQEAYLKYSFLFNKNIGNYKLALEYQEQYSTSKDSLRKALNDKALLDKKIEFETTEKELKNQALLQTNEIISSNNKKITAALIGVLTLLSGLLYFFMKNKKANKLINEQNVELTSLNETKNRLFAIISHDLRNEVSAFQNINKIYEHHLQNKNYERLEELTKQVDKGAITVNSLMDNLLQWSSSQLHGIKLNPQSINLNEQTKSIVDLFNQYSLTKGITINTDIADNDYVLADINSLQFIIRNVISNAIKFSEDGDNIQISAVESSDGLSLKIADTGLGIPAEKLEKLWQIDKKSSRTGTAGERGTGIGLSLVKDFVEKNNGKIHIESKEGQGTTVTITLPKAA